MRSSTTDSAWPRGPVWGKLSTWGGLEYVPGPEDLCGENYLPGGMYPWRPRGHVQGKISTWRYISLAQRTCVGKNIYLEVCIPGDLEDMCREKYLPGGVYPWRPRGHVQGNYLPEGMYPWRPRGPVQGNYLPGGMYPWRPRGPVWGKLSIWRYVSLETQRTCVGKTIYLEVCNPIYLFCTQVGWNYVDFTHQLVKFHRPKNKTAEEYRNLTLFRTKFVNSSDDKQRYTFHTERQTKSSCSLSVQKGYTLGAITNLEFALPTNAAPGVSYTQKGYTLGATTNLEFALPTNAAPGVSYTQNGYTLGATTNLEFALPTNAAPGVSYSQKGYTLGATTNLEFALPTNTAPGVSNTQKSYTLGATTNLEFALPTNVATGIS